MGDGGGAILMEKGLYDNLVAMIKGKDRDSLEVAIQILLQDIDEETSAAVFEQILEDPKLVMDPELKKDISNIFKRCSQTIINNRVKKL